jgi:RNA polymerase sigma-70 factor (ECF subfamily)
MKTLKTIRLRRELIRLRPRLYRMALAWSGNSSQADDLVQDAMIKVLGKLAQLRDPGRLERWAFSILANCYRDSLRRGDYLVSQPQENIDQAQAQASAEEDVMIEQRQQWVRRAIARLSPNQREVMLLVDLEGFSYAEVAEILALPMGTVMSRLSRGRERLREILAGSAGEHETGRFYLERVK